MKLDASNTVITTTVMHLGRHTSFSPDHRQNSQLSPEQINSLTFLVGGNPVLYIQLTTTTCSSDG